MYNTKRKLKKLELLRKISLGLIVASVPVLILGIFNVMDEFKQSTLLIYSAPLGLSWLLYNKLRLMIIYLSGAFFDIDENELVISRRGAILKFNESSPAKVITYGFKTISLIATYGKSYELFMGDYDVPDSDLKRIEECVKKLNIVFQEALNTKTEKNNTLG